MNISEIKEELEYFIREIERESLKETLKEILKLFNERFSKERYFQAAEAVSAAWQAAPEGEGVMGAEAIAALAARLALEEGLEPRAAVEAAIQRGATYHKNPMYVLIEPEKLKELKARITYLEKQCDELSWRLNPSTWS